MLTAVFSDYKGHPEETRESDYPQFGMPSYTVEGDRPRKMTLVGSVDFEIDDRNREDLRNWFFNKCLMGLDPVSRVVEIEAELPDGFEQWYFTAEYYKEIK